MRQGILLVPIFFVLIFVLYLFTPNFTWKTRPELFIGRNALVVINQQNLSKRIAEFSHSPLGKTLKGIDYNGIGEALDISPERVEKVEGFKNLLIKLTNDPLFNVLAGRDVTLALMPFKRMENVNLAQQMLENTLIISRPKYPVKLIDLAGKMMGQDPEIEQISYGNHLIKRYDVPDNHRISLVKTRDLFVISLNERLLRRALDTFDEGKNSLGGDPDYRRKRKDFSGASFFCYFKLEELPPYLDDIVEMAPLIDKENLIQDFEILEGYEDGYFGIWREGDRIYDKAVIDFDKKNVPHQLGSWLKKEAEHPKSYKRISKDAIYYYWTNSFDPQEIVDHFENPSANGLGEGKKELLGKIEEVTGMKGKEMAELLENDLTVAIKKIPDQQLVPIPLFMIVIRSNDPEKLKTCIEKIIDYYEIPVHRYSLKGIEVVAWGGMMGMGRTLPSIAFVGDYLLLSSNSEQIKEFVTLPDSKSGLDRSSLFNLVDDNLKEMNNSATYINLAEMAKVFKELVSWGGTMIAIQDREGARKSKIVIDRLVNPIVDGLSMYSLIGSRKIIDNDAVIIESTTVVNDGN